MYAIQRKFSRYAVGVQCPKVSVDVDLAAILQKHKICF